MMALRVLAVTLAALVTLPATAFENENLLVTAPAGYKAGFSDRNAKMVMTEFVPDGQTVGNWTEMVTVQIFFGMKTTPDQFRGKMDELWRKSCDHASSQSIAVGAENGYPFAFWQLTCPLNPATGKPETTWFKAIAGRDSFYVVQKAFKFVPEKEQVIVWSRYLKGVVVCDTRLPERACPKGMQ